MASKETSGRERARNLRIIDVPDFTLALILYASGDEALAAETAARLFQPDEIAAGRRIESQLKSVAAQLAERRLVALPVLAGSEPMRQAVRAAKDAHAPVTGLLLGAAQAPGGAVSAIELPDSPQSLRRTPLACDLRGESGPFDIIGDVHGCFEELTALLEKLGWTLGRYRRGETLLKATPPEGRRAIFVGDLTDRGPRNVDALRLAMGMVRDGAALITTGNHDHKLRRMLQGANVKRSHGLAETEEELLGFSEGFRDKVRVFLEGLPDHLWLDGGDLLVVHAGLMDDMHGRVGGAVRTFALFGDVTGERDEYGLPIRGDWAARYTGRAAVIYGHTPMNSALWRGKTLCVDTGCCFGGEMTALRWPERELVSVPAARQYSKPIRPLGDPEPLPPQ